MRKVFVLLIASVLLLPIVPAAAAMSYAAPFAVTALAAAPFDAIHAAVLAPSRATAPADSAVANWAAILATNSTARYVTVDGRRLHFVRAYARILWSPGVKNRGSVTAATQRTRAVQPLTT